MTDEVKIAGVIHRSEIVEGDYIAFLGGPHISSIAGTVIKAARVNLTLSGDYMGHALEIKIRRDKPEGQGRLKRGELIYDIVD